MCAVRIFFFFAPFPLTCGFFINAISVSTLKITLRVLWVQAEWKIIINAPQVHALKVLGGFQSLISGPETFAWGSISSVRNVEP